MLNKTIENDIRNLFSEKKYDELIERIEKISNFENRAPGISSMPMASHLAFSILSYIFDASSPTGKYLLKVLLSENLLRRA